MGVQADKPDPDKDPGGTGAMSKADYDHQRGNLRMLRMAIRKRWIIPKDADEVLPNEMYQIATTREVPVLVGDGDESHTVMMPNARAQVAATKILLEMEKQNQDDEHKQQDAANANAGTGPTVIVVERTASPSHAPTLPPGPATDDPGSVQIQRGDVRAAERQDDNGRVSGD